MSEQPVNFGSLLQGVGSLSFEPVPVGDYDVFVETAEYKPSSTGKPMWKVKYKISGGPQHGRTIYNNIVLTADNANTLRMFFLNMKAMGLDETFFASNPAPQLVAQSLVGKTCHVAIDHRAYQGQMRENVKSLSPAGAGVIAGAVAGIGAAPSIPGPGAVPPAPSVVPQAAPPVAPAAPVVPPAPPVAAPPAPPVAPPIPPAPPVQDPTPLVPAAAPAIPDDQAAQFAAWQAQQAALAAAPVAPVEAPPAPAAPAGVPLPPASPF